MVGEPMKQGDRIVTISGQAGFFWTYIPVSGCPALYLQSYGWLSKLWSLLGSLLSYGAWYLG